MKNRKINKTEQPIPYEELMTLPASFAFANCDRRQIVIDGVEQALRRAAR